MTSLNVIADIAYWPDTDTNTRNWYSPIHDRMQLPLGYLYVAIYNSTLRVCAPAHTHTRIHTLINALTLCVCVCKYVYVCLYACACVTCVMYACA